jgi:hypothetical protein
MNTINHYTDFHNAEKVAKDYHAVISLGHFLPERFRESQKYLFLDFQDFDFIDLEIDPTNAKFAPNAEPYHDSSISNDQMKIGRTTYTEEQTKEIERVKEIISNLQKEIDVRYENLRRFLKEEDEFLWDYVYNDFKLEIKDEQ